MDPATAPGPARVRGRGHIACSGRPHLRFAAMKRINCVCGLVVEGDDDDELWENAQQHMRDDHPDLVGKVLRDDIVAQAEETGSTQSS
jgi:predicted small metal-binding protein